MSMYTVFDLETTISMVLKRRASPFGGVNKIVAIGDRRDDTLENRGQYFGAEGAPDGWFAELLDNTKFLVGFNIKFDILHAICAGPLNREAWIKFIDEGGQVWDCQLAEYLLHGQAQDSQIISMDQTAPRYGGNLKDDAVKSMWQAGIDTPDIPKDLLMDYLIGTGPGDLGDIGNTELIFKAQLAALRARGSLKSILLNMGALCFTIEAEYNGMHVDKAWALEEAARLKAELVQLDKDLKASLPADLPFEFKWTSRFHKSALIFGGGIKYVAKEPILDEAGNQTYAQQDSVQYLLLNGETTPDAPGSGTISPLDYATNKGGKNAGEFKTKKVKVDNLDKPKFRNVDKVYTFPGVTEPDPKWESSTPGVYSTAGEIIDELGKRDIPFLKLVSRRQDVHKDLSTYFIIEDEDGNFKGMLTLVGDDGIIHHSLHMNRTITGRLSSSDPNLQNVSKGEEDSKTGEWVGSKIKFAFTSRFLGGFIIQSDFTSLEIYVQAVLTMCRQLLEDLKAGLDMHVLRAEQAWGKAAGKDYDYILAAAKDDTHEEHKIWKKKRGNAKVFSFQRAYGAGVKKIAETTGMSEEEVEALIAAEAERYPELGAYIDMVTATIQSNRQPTQRFVQHPDFPGMTVQLGKSYFFTPDRKMYSYNEHPAPKWVVEAKRGLTSFSPTEIKNYVVQGTGGEWAKAAMYLCLRAFYRMYRTGHPMWREALLVNQVHDAVYVDAAPNVATAAAALMHACMIEASTYMDYWFDWPLPIGVPCETKMGSSMMEEKNPPPEFDGMQTKFRAYVRREFINNHTPAFEKE